MSSKIFKSIWFAALTVFLASLIIILGISYTYFTNLQWEQLRNEAELAAQGVSLCGDEYFTGLQTENYRITRISPSGTVLYDNEADSAAMENHLQREEVIEALESGYGEASRYSGTLADRQLYAAKRLPDGSVLRVSIVHAAVWTLLWSFAQPLCVVIVIALALSFALASRLARRIVKPINDLDPEHPEEYYGEEDYKEIEPLLRHISRQKYQLKKDREQIEKTALIRQEFSANVSHELKTPLHAISGYAELIESGMVNPEDVKPFAAKIRRESSRMTKLVEDIINLTELDSGGSKMEWEQCDLLRIAENAAGSLENAAAKAEVLISVAGSEAPIYAVPQVLYSIVYNLCDNAIKYNRKGGCVTVTLRRNSKETVLSVKDNGVGIPADCLGRIFERFYRVDKSRSKEVGGTGLGLSIVKHGVMIHNGSIEVNSEPGRGTEFTVTLPNEPKEV